jgi:hypothetical protein
MVGDMAGTTPKHLVAGGERGDALADGLHHAGEVTAERDWYSCSTIPLSIPAAIAPSIGLTDDARTRTRTSPAAGVGDGASERSAGAAPSWSMVIACMVPSFEELLLGSSWWPRQP